MPTFSKSSTERLYTCDPRLIDLFHQVVKHYDCTIIQGHRDMQTQNKYFSDGKSKVVWPNSKHNPSPSKAVDVAPYPLDWNDKERFYHFAGYVTALADVKGLGIRWGGDWDGDFDFNDQHFNDLVHFEIVD